MLKKIVSAAALLFMLPAAVFGADVSKREVSDGVYLVADNTATYGESHLEDKDGNALTEDYWAIKPLAPSAGLYQFSVPAGHSDAQNGVLRLTDSGAGIVIEADAVSYNAVDAGEGSFFFPVLTNGEYYTPSGDKIADLGTYLKPYGISMQRSDWADEAVKAGFDTGFMPPSIAYNFKNGITRAEFCRLCIQAYESSLYLIQDADLKDSYDSPYSDTDDWYVLAASDLGIVSGYPDGTFKPDKLITRQEAAVLLGNLCARFDTKLTTVSVSSFADDDKIASWSKDFVYNICALTCGSGDAVMVGTSGGNFSPESTYTREQAIVTMYRILYNVI